MRIFLAPMEGVVDYEMRDELTRLGGYDRCVTEFIRVTDQLLPDKIFFKFSPELHHGGRTHSGVPVYLQLLGGSPKYMALNAANAAKLEPTGIDINFGCPSKTVTRNNGGSSLLKEPERVGNIVAAVRDAVDSNTPVTAKIRLGFDNSDSLHEIVDRVALAGANELCIHARTRTDQYKPPAHWHQVKGLQEKYDMPITINGEIWSYDDALMARQDSGCEDIMIGRGAMTVPDLAQQIKSAHLNEEYTALSWDEILVTVTRYLHSTESKHPTFIANRLKQWLAFLQKQYPEALELFHQVKKLRTPQEIYKQLDSVIAKT